MKTTSQKIINLENRKDRTHYTGKFNSLQEFGNFCNEKPYSQYEQDPYTEYQNFLYKRALFGLKMYTQEEIKTMHWQKRKRILKVHKRTQSVINIWKQEITNHYTNCFFQQIFPKSPIALDIIKESHTDKHFKSSVSFKDLSIKKNDVIKKLHQEGVLPKDFFELKK
jgi:hypothetical protein